MIEEFREYLRLDEKSDNTILKYIRDVKLLKNYMDGAEVSKENILCFKEYLRQSYEISSANSIIAAINAFFRFLSWEYCSIKQFKVQKDAYCSESKELTKGEYMSLVKAAQKENNERLALIVQTICATGIRVSELQWITAEAA